MCFSQMQRGRGLAQLQAAGDRLTLFTVAITAYRHTPTFPIQVFRTLGVSNHGPNRNHKPQL